MLNWQKVVFFMLIAIFAAGNAQAQREFADIYTECGLGAMIAPSNDAVAAVTNVTWDLGTTAITSNISSPSTCVGGKEKMASFIHQSQDLLFSDIASGNGEYLDALIAIAGVNGASKDQFVSSVRQNSASFVSEQGFQAKSRFEKAQALYNIVLDSLSKDS